jgi:hypothetical protein
MKITLESTDQIVCIAAEPGGAEIECRVWQGHTGKGTPVQVIIPRIATPNGGCIDRQFDQDLREVSAPLALPLAFPLRMVI